jgi:hypothetical protein
MSVDDFFRKQKDSKRSFGITANDESFQKCPSHDDRDSKTKILSVGRMKNPQKN